MECATEEDEAAVGIISEGWCGLTDLLDERKHELKPPEEA